MSGASFRPRVSLVSEDLSLPIDEGLKKFVYSIIEPMERRVDLQVLSTWSSSRPGPPVEVAAANVLMVGQGLRTALRSFAPDAVIYVARAGGTRNSFVRSRMLRLYRPGAKHVLVSLQPRPLQGIARLMARAVHPDVFVAQSNRTRDHLISLGIPAVAVPSGVDVDSFHPVSASEKALLRAKYGLPSEKPVVLHIGHLQRRRNVLLLDRIQKELACAAVMVGSTSTDVEPDVVDVLRRAGVTLISTYIERVAELYQLADCYLFPVHASGSAIEMPLSVLEAMACGIPVVSTRFGSLPDWLCPSSGFRYADSDEELLQEVSSVLSSESLRPDDIRSQVMSLSWDAVALRLLTAAGAVSPTVFEPEHQAITSEATAG